MGKVVFAGVGKTDREIAEAYSRGELIPVAVPRYEPVFKKLLNRIASEVQAGA